MKFVIKIIPKNTILILDEWMDPNSKFFVNRKEDRTKFLLEKDRMKGEYLGACLDYIRWGAINVVMYPLNMKDLIAFIQEWMVLNKDDLIWSDKELPIDFKLPFMDYKVCPRGADHKETIADLSGKIRCAHSSEKKLRPNLVKNYNFFDPLSQCDKTEYIEVEPHDENNSEKPITTRDLCYAIISDKGTTLSLEKIIKRLNITPEFKMVYCLEGYNGCTPERISKMTKEEKEADKEYHFGCRGHEEPNNQLVFPFDGWTLAGYIEKWYNQLPEGKASVFMKPNDKDTYKVFLNFRVISGGD